MTIPSTSAGSPVLEVRDLAVSYGGVVQALRGVSLTVQEGSVVALLGSNGAGKTTLLRTLSGTLRLHRGRVERGEVSYRGADLRGRDAAACVASGLVQVPEGRRIFTRLTVEENLKAGVRVTTWPHSSTAADPLLLCCNAKARTSWSGPSCVPRPGNVGQHQVWRHGRLETWPGYPHREMAAPDPTAYEGEQG